MKNLIEKIEAKDNELYIVEAKVRFPESYANEETEIELLKIKNELSNLNKEAKLETKIETQKSLLYEQLSEYIRVIQKQHQLPFSKSQGLSYDLFYISPLMNIKQIVFITQLGLARVNYNLTLSDNDAVENKEVFLDFLNLKRLEIKDLRNLSELYEFYKSFAETIRKQFITR
mgnify:CR=1 FL=1